MIAKHNLTKVIGKPAMLEQTAEECMEMAFACMKLARMMRGENKLWGHTEPELVCNIEDEMADLLVCFEELQSHCGIDSKCVDHNYEYKLTRMRDRITENAMQQGLSEEEKNKKLTDEEVDALLNGLSTGEMKEVPDPIDKDFGEVLEDLFSEDKPGSGEFYSGEFDSGSRYEA